MTHPNYTTPRVAYSYLVVRGDIEEGVVVAGVVSGGVVVGRALLAAHVAAHLARYRGSDRAATHRQQNVV